MEENVERTIRKSFGLSFTNGLRWYLKSGKNQTRGMCQSDVVSDEGRQPASQSEGGGVAFIE